MIRIAVFASGFGSNLQALIDYQEKYGLGGKINLVFSNNHQAVALQRAKKNNIKTESFGPSDFKSRKQYDCAISEMLDRKKIDLVVLAGYMLLLGNEIISKYKNRIINIHPALLPSFKGTHGIRDAYDYGAKITGVTVHFVDKDLDSGPVIMQEAVSICQDDAIGVLEEKIHDIEHKIYPLAVKYFCEGSIVLEGRKVSIKSIKQRS